MTAKNVTELLQRVAGGDLLAEAALYDCVYGDLRRAAHAILGPGRRSNRLGTTELVNESYLRLTGAGPQTYASRFHFLSVASKAMRSILVDAARREGRQKRRHVATPLPAEGVPDGRAVGPELVWDVLDLHEGLEALRVHDERQAKIIELRTFLELTRQEVAELFGLSAETIRREERHALAWLRLRLDGRRSG